MKRSLLICTAFLFTLSGCGYAIAPEIDKSDIIEEEGLVVPPIEEETPILQPGIDFKTDEELYESF